VTLQDITNYVAERDKAPKTVLKYRNQIKNFVKWCDAVQLKSFPSEVTTVCTYLLSLLYAGKKHSTIDGYRNAISSMYKHSESINPTYSTIVQSTMEAIKRSSPPPVKKIPVRTVHLQTLAEKVSEDSFLEVRDQLTYCLMFKGMLRSDSAVLLEAEDVWIEIIDEEEVLFVFIEKSKNDQYRRGHTLVIGKGQTLDSCPIHWYKKYSLLRDDNAKPFLHKKSTLANWKTSHLSASTINSSFKKRLKTAGIKTHLTSHCLRAGGATAALEKGVELRLVKRHGNWRSDAVFAYITESIKNQLTVTTLF
jgi:site-specific recombinase XerD